jgi:single-stranded-DNA-specific exonuclease
MKMIWKIKPENQKLRKRLSQSLGISEICAQLLVNRGIASVKQAQDFLGGGLRDLHDPWLLKGMKKAVARIKKAIAAGEKIMVWGDYDIDGITATAVLLSVLKEVGAEVLHYLPNRLEEGYGLNKNGARLAKKKGVSLLITVDCGISANKEIDYLNRLGIDTIITDHHQPKEGQLPKSFAIINPLQKGCTYPYKYLAGVGLAAKLAACVLGTQAELLDRHLDIIALGTVGDIVSLTGENRILVRAGLVALKQTKKLGLKALLQVAGLSNREINAGHIGYILGPRINASGRLGSPEDSLRLLLVETELEAQHLAQKLNKGNRTRQRIANQTLQEAVAQVESRINFKEHKVIVLGAANWHQGVIGIVASRLVERYLRPAIMLSLADGFGRGSGRSIGNFHLLQAVSRCKDLLEEYGGHKRACGLRLKKANLADFSRSINRVAEKMLVPEDLIPTLEIDMAVPLRNLNAEMLEQLDLLSPFGADNRRPLLVSSGLKVRQNAFLVGGNHLKFWVTDGELTCEAIGYSKADVFPQLSQGETVDLVYTPSLNSWQGNRSIQLRIEDLKVT